MRKYICLLLLVLNLFYIFSQEQDITTLSEKEIIKLIDKTIEEKDSNIISYLTTLGSDFPGYSKFEKYILKKAKELAESEDLNFPLQLVEAVLYNNLENSEAQDLYVLIINNKINIEERAIIEKEKEKIKREELKELTENVEEIFTEESRKATIIENNLLLLSEIESYSTVFNKKHYTTNSYFYPLLHKYYESEVYDGFNSRNATVNDFAGFGFEFGYGVEYSLFTLRMDLTGNITSKDLLNDELRQFTISSNISIGLTKFNIPIFLRSGYLYDAYLFEDMDESDVAITTMPTPTVGLGIRGFNFLKILKLDYSTDLLLAPFITDNIDLGLYNRLFLTINLIRFGIYNIEVRGGFDYLFYSEGGLTEYNFTPRFGFGISSYE